MKTHRKTLFSKEYSSPISYGTNSTHKVKTKIKVEIIFSFKEGVWFAILVGNFGCSDKNIFKAFVRALEHESIGMAKYDQMKCDTRKLGLYNKLDVI